jgi:hypothetical protein
VAAVVAAAAALGACGGSPAPSAGPGARVTPPAAAGWLTYTRTGGFAGVDDHVVVATDGAVAVSTKGRAEHRYRLTAAETTRLRRLADAVDPAAHPSAAPSGAGTADAFDVRLEIAGRSVAVPEGQVPADVAPLLAELQRLAGRG